MRRLRILLIVVLALPSGAAWADDLLDLLPKDSTKLDYTYQYANIDVQPTRGIWTSGTLEIYVPGRAMSMREMAKIRAAFRPVGFEIEYYTITSDPADEFIPPKAEKIELAESVTNTYVDIELGADVDLVNGAGSLTEILDVQDENDTQVGDATDIIPVPEPITLTLLGIGGLSVIRRRNK